MNLLQLIHLHTCEKDLFMCSSTSMMAAMLPHLAQGPGEKGSRAGVWG